MWTAWQCVGSQGCIKVFARCVNCHTLYCGCKVSGEYLLVSSAIFPKRSVEIQDTLCLLLISSPRSICCWISLLVVFLSSCRSLSSLRLPDNLSHSSSSRQPFLGPSLIAICLDTSLLLSLIRPVLGLQNSSGRNNSYWCLRGHGGTTN